MKIKVWGPKNVTMKNYPVLPENMSEFICELATIDLLCELTWHPARSHSARLCETHPHTDTGLHLCAWYRLNSLATLAAYKNRQHNEWTRVAMILVGVCPLMLKYNSVLTGVFQAGLRFLDHNGFDPPASVQWFSLPLKNKNNTGSCPVILPSS